MFVLHLDALLQQKIHSLKKNSEKIERQNFKMFLKNDFKAKK